MTETAISEIISTYKARSNYSQKFSMGDLTQSGVLLWKEYWFDNIFKINNNWHLQEILINTAPY